jgi:hypothetical protein
MRLRAEKAADDNEALRARVRDQEQIILTVSLRALENEP